MSFTSANNSTGFFSVVGSAYVAEGHSERISHLPPHSDFEQFQVGLSGLWMSFFAVIGFSLTHNAPAAKAMQIASAALH
jgi:hypothetical protein